jgi:mRNA interferase MazF
MPLRGEVWRVDFEPTRGSELRKVRPAVVISSDHVGRLPVKLVAPITGWKDAFARNVWHVHLDSDEENGLDKVSAVDALQVRAVAVERFVERLGAVTGRTMADITAAVAAVIEHE